MKNASKARAVLIVGSILIFITFVLSFVLLITDLINNEYNARDRGILRMAYAFMLFPVVLEEASLLRSVYKLVKHKPDGAAKICWIISAAVVACALVFQMLCYTNVITQNIFPEGPKAASSRFTVLQLIVEWSALIISLVLGSVKHKKNEQTGNS